MYIYTVIDLHTRMAYARISSNLTEKGAAETIFEAQKFMGFSFKMVQSDNGAEFQRRFQERLNTKGIKTRHSRVRHPNDDAHIERFNRTLRKECIGQYNPNKKIDLRLVGKTLDNQDIIIASDTLLNGVSYRSDQIHANTKKDGDFDKNTGILSEEQMNAQLEYAKKIAAKGAEEIDLGFIKPTPYENACEYYKYKGMCGYDCKTMGERKVDKIGLEAILEAVSEDKGE